MSKLTKDQILVSDSLADVFKTNKDANLVFATTDGQFFLEPAKSYAKNHAFKNGEECLEITRAEFEQAGGAKKNKKSPETKKDSDKENTKPVKEKDHVVTQADLDNNKELVERGVKVGDTIQIPVNE